MNTTFKCQFEVLLQSDKLKPLVRDYQFFTLASNNKPWFDTGITLEIGDCVSSFAIGQTQLKGLPISLDPNFQLWFRIGLDNEIFRGTRDSHSFTAEQSGRLYLCSYFPGEWSTKTGELVGSDEVYDLVTGEFTVVLIRWQDKALESLKVLEKQGDVDNRVHLEIERIQSPVLPPEDWYYLWFLGAAEIYRSCKTPENHDAVCCHTHKDCGLLQKTVVLPLIPNTRLCWSWKMDLLPSTVREDTLPTHDYLSIAVEFDNGQDITYYWSAELAPETVYRCPIPSWNARETHVVIRSGTQGLGEWLEEERDVYADYSIAIGSVMPKQIVRVWLIAVSLFQRQEGRCQYADIRFLSDEQIISVL